MKNIIPHFYSSFKNDTLFYGIAVLIERAVGFLIIPLLTKSLEPALYGVWSQMIVSISFFSIFILIGFFTAAVQFLAARKSDKETSVIFHGMLGTVLLNSVLVLLLIFVFAKPLSEGIFGDVHFVRFVYALGFFVVGDALWEMVTAFLRARKEMVLFSAYYVCKNLIRIGILLFGILIFHMDLLEIIGWIVVTQALFTFFIYLKHIVRKVGFSISLGGVPWREILFFSLPLVPYALLVWLSNSVARYSILYIFDIVEVSVYAVSYSLAGVIGIFYIILGATLYPYMAKRWNEGDPVGAGSMLRSAMEYYIFFATPAIAVFTILGSPIIQIFSTDDYLSHWSILFLLALGVSVFGIYELAVYATFAAKKTFWNAIILFLLLSPGILLSVFLTQTFGIWGAALATLLINTVLALATILVGRGYVPYSFPWGTLHRVVLTTFILSLFLLAARHYLNVYNVWILGSIVLGAGMLYVLMDVLSEKSFLLRLRKNFF